ncbi:MAG TPA: formimidoylglutamase [Candidatus Kryptonia bacterium]
MEQFWNFLDEPDPAILYKRGEKGDRRFGESVETKREKLGDNIKVVVVGFPYDEGTVRNRGRAGSAAGPDEIRRALYKLTPTKSSAVSDAELRIFDAGNIKREMKLEDALAHLEEVDSYALRNGMIPIAIGGSNDMSFPNGRACKNVLGRCGVINIDSHLDVRDYSKGINSGTPYRMLIEEKDILASDFVEYGIQEFVNSREHILYVEGVGGQIYSLGHIRSQKNCNAFMEAYRHVSESTDHVYVSFDIDSVRSSDAPGASAPTPTGLTAEEILECAYLAGTEEKTAMIDICELNPKYDLDSRTAKLAAMIIANFLTGISNRR